MSADVTQVAKYVSDGADLNATDSDGRTPLACAIRGGSMEVVKALVEGGANVNKNSEEGLPLYLAAREGRVDMVTLLLDNEADINARDASGATALHGAAIGGSRAVAELLLAKGADANAQNSMGLTALSLAQVAQRTDIVELLQARAQTRAPIGRAGDPSSMAQRMERGRMARQNGGAEAPAMRTVPTARPMSDAGTAAALVTPSEVLRDPNAIRAKIAAFVELRKALAELEDSSATVQRLWQRQTSDNRTTVLRMADTQFTNELTMLKTTAQKENAPQTVQAIDALAAKRQERYDLVSEALREQRRAEILAEREAERANRTRGTTARGRGRTGVGVAAEAAAPPTRTYAMPTTRDPNAPQLDAETERLLQAWETSALDKRPLLEIVAETDLADLNALRESAVSESADETAAAIEGLMLARQLRHDSILDEIAADEERQARREERANARTRGATEETTGRTGRRLR